MCAVGGFVHAMAFFQQLEKLLYWDSRVRRTSQRENLPHQDSKRPTVEAISIFKKSVKDLKKRFQVKIYKAVLLSSGGTHLHYSIPKQLNKLVFQTQGIPTQSTG